MIQGKRQYLVRSRRHQIIVTSLVAGQSIHVCHVDVEDGQDLLRGKPPWTVRKYAHLVAFGILLHYLQVTSSHPAARLVAVNFSEDMAVDLIESNDTKQLVFGNAQLDWWLVHRFMVEVEDQAQKLGLLRRSAESPN